MLITLVLLGLVVVAATVILTVKAKRESRTVQLHQLIPLQGLAVLLVVAFVGAILLFVRWDQYHRCVQRVESREGNRAQHLWILDELERQGLTDIARRGRIELDTNTPALDRADCQKP